MYIAGKCDCIVTMLLLNSDSPREYSWAARGTLIKISDSLKFGNDNYTVAT